MEDVNKDWKNDWLGVTTISSDAYREYKTFLRTKKGKEEGQLIELAGEPKIEKYSGIVSYIVKVKTKMHSRGVISNYPWMDRMYRELGKGKQIDNLEEKEVLNFLDDMTDTIEEML